MDTFTTLSKQIMFLFEFEIVTKKVTIDASN